MPKSKIETGIFHNGIPYVRFDGGPRDLVIFSGGPGNDLLSGMMLQLFASSLKPLAKTYTIYAVSRKSGLRADYSTRDMSDDYAAMIREEFKGPVDIIGLSLGGLIAQHFGADHSDLVRRLVIAMAAYRVSESGKKIDSRAAELLSKGKRGSAGSTFASAIYPKGFKKYFFKLILWLLGSLTPGGTSDSYSKDVLVEAEAIIKHDSRDRLPEIKVPTLVICGEEDFYFPSRYVRETAELIADSKLIFYKNKGHDIVFTKKFFEDIMAFLREDQSLR